MGAIKREIIRLEEKFFVDAEHIMRESESFLEALDRINAELQRPYRSLCSEEQPFDDQLLDMWEEIWAKYGDTD